jgi:hypothetical protein
VLRPDDGMVYENCRVYGPYSRKRDKRQHVVLVYPDLSKQTVSYPKFLMEQHLGRYLLPNETVDHINRDCTDNRIENLQILDRKHHASLDAKRVDKSTQEFTCPVCKDKFTLEGNTLQDRLNKMIRINDYKGPFCSRKCSSKYGRDKQLKKDAKYETQFREKRIYYLDK